MAEVGFDRRPTVLSHSELTSGHNVTHLLSHINQNYKQSKADQILRLLREQDKITNHIPNDTELIEEYNQIREETVICDSDTLTDSSSDSEVDLKERDSKPEALAERFPDRKEKAENHGHNGSRSRTSLGFRNLNVDAVTMGSNFDTRVLSLRPKSSYVRRNQYKYKQYNVETETNDANNVDDAYNELLTQRFVKSARPKSRLGRASVPMLDRKAALMETDVTVGENVLHTENTVKKNAVNVYNRFACTRPARWECQRSNEFCDSNSPSRSEQTADNMSLDSSSDSMDIRDEMFVNSVQIHANARRDYNSKISHASSFENNVPRNSPNQLNPQQSSVLQNQRRLHNSPIRSESTINSEYSKTDNVQEHVRSGTATGNGNMHSERSDSAHMRLLRNNYNVARPRNPESVSSRSIERPDMCSSSGHRCLQRRFMQQSQHLNTAIVRPTSESVTLARQKTEKILFNKHNEYRPYSEKVIVNSNKNILSVTENPAQGPQTLVTSKGGVTQASHVQASGFRSYDATRRLKLSVQARDVPEEMTLPQQMHQSNILIGGRKPLTLMKLPSLEASLAPKKKETGLTLAQQETCV